MWLLPPRRAARPPPRCLVWHRGIGPGGNGARRGSDAPGHWPHHGLVLLEGSEEGVSSSMGSSSNPPTPRDCHLAYCELRTHSWWGIRDLSRGKCLNTPPTPLSLALGCSRQRRSAVAVPAGWAMPAAGCAVGGGKGEEREKLKDGVWIGEDEGWGSNLAIRGQAGTSAGIWEAAARGLGQDDGQGTGRGTGRGLAGDWLLR